MLKAIVLTLICAVAGATVATPDARAQAREFDFFEVESADLQISSVDDVMTVYVNGRKVEEARFGEAPPRRSILRFLKRGPNAIMVDIWNAEYGGCGGALTVRVNQFAVLQRRWAVPIEKAPYRATCIREVLTLNLD